MGQDFNLGQAQPMVGWFSPRLLFRALFQQTVAGLFGQYADQRTIQQLEDPFPEDAANHPKFLCRHDYSAEAKDGEAFWADFVADLGDGFDSTYSVAYMLAADALRGADSPATPKISAVRDLARHEVLPHGKILIMGGDQVYPWPTPEAYRERLQLPYALALPALKSATAPMAGHMMPGLAMAGLAGFHGAAPAGSATAHPADGAAPAAMGHAHCTFKDNERHVFAIPGNHDWYDGLFSFDQLFCAARGKSNQREAVRFGAWATRQHRSYFAIKLPYDWWIWGADIQLSEHLDAGQLNYFRSVAQQMGPRDKFVLVAAQPSWLQFGTPREPQARANLRSLIDMPLRRGAKICGILSGDTHHYSRYNESDVLGNFNLVIAGGGGAYIHGTHHLKDEIKFDWVDREVSFRLDKRLEPKADPSGMTTAGVLTNERATYPDRAQSIGLAAGNWKFPFRNLTFAVAMGAIYWLLTWAISEMQVQHPHSPAVESLIESQKKEERQAPTALSERVQQRQVQQKIDKEIMTRGLAPPPPAAPSAEPTRTDGKEKKEQETVAVRRWMLAEVKVFAEKYHAATTAAERWREFTAIVQRTIYMLLAGLASSPATTVFVAAVFAVFVLMSETRHRGWAGRASRMASGSTHFVLHALAMWGLYCVLAYNNNAWRIAWEARCSDDAKLGWLPKFLCPNKADSTFLLLPPDIWERLVYPVEMIVLGGLAAGTIFGIWLAIGHVFGRINSDWAFSARGNPGFRNFLRLKFEPNRLTIYPIGLDSPPRLRQRWAIPGWLNVDNPEPGKPRVEPRFRLRPRLIEGPIVINANEVRNIPRKPDTDV